MNHAPSTETIHTSISMPKNFLGQWATHEKKLIAQLDRYLRWCRNGTPRRDRARIYNHEGEMKEKVSVYWELEVYNKLHSVAFNLRLSVSHLLYLMLIKLLSGGLAAEVFGKYLYFSKSWTDSAFEFSEKLIYSDYHPWRTVENFLR